MSLSNRQANYIHYNLDDLLALGSPENTYAWSEAPVGVGVMRELHVRDLIERAPNGEWRVTGEAWERVEEKLEERGMEERR